MRYNIVQERGNPVDKHTAQTALPENIRDLYDQIISRGRIGELTQQIIEEPTPEIEPEMPREIDIEPDR